jgi:methyltransferase (TIGR00027 family)
MKRTGPVSPGHTSVLAAVGRGLHLEGPPPLLIADDLALELAGDAGAAVLVGLRSAAPPGSLATLGRTFALRARLLEDEVEQAARAGVRQYVILGAGLDSFAYRRADLGAGLRVFEVDRPEPQTWKRDRLAGLGIPEPSNTSYVPVDFETSELGGELISAGVDFSAPAVISWMAVTQYLSREAIAGSLGILAGFPPGTRLVLTHVVPPVGLTELEGRGLAWTMSQAAERGEPFLTLLTPEAADALLRGHGFSAVEHYGPAELQRRYLPALDPTDLPGIERIIVATR